ncbi:MAG: HupE/UreJ family protein [Nitrosomonas sp.]|nr:HupE/UreJ family protein [Nitrosomonas sp.]MDP1950461.1 HupE/UreJ family protein [Nitrosomonas sp.]
MPSWVQAHTGISPQSGWIYGFTHPINGLDHVLTMVAVGLWAGQTGGRAIWLMPLTFVFTMALGGLLGMVTLPFAYAEHGIIFSLLMAGVLIASAIRLPLFASTLLIAVFAIGHGYAHGSEMPAGISVPAYAAGFMLATALLHTAGIGIALVIKSSGHSPWLRLSGVVVALYGGFLFAN